MRLAGAWGRSFMGTLHECLKEAKGIWVARGSFCRVRLSETEKWKWSRTHFKCTRLPDNHYWLHRSPGFQRCKPVWGSGLKSRACQCHTAG